MTTIQYQIKKLEDELQHLKGIVARQPVKVDIGEGDFAFLDDVMYIIVRNNGKYSSKDKYIGVRTNSNGVAWLRFQDATSFAKHCFGPTYERLCPTLCDISALV